MHAPFRLQLLPEHLGNLRIAFFINFIGEGCIAAVCLKLPANAFFKLSFVLLMLEFLNTRVSSKAI